MELFNKTLFKDVLQEKRKKKFLWFIWILIILMLLIFFFKDRIIFYLPDKIIYFTEDFSKGTGSWISLDSDWYAGTDDANGITRLSRKDYASPYLMYKLPIEKSPPQEYVYHVRFKIYSFTNEAVTLASLIYPTGQITIVVNNNGAVGLSQNLFDMPIYNKSHNKRLKFNEWNDIYVMVNGKDDRVKVFLNSKVIINQEYKSDISPVQELWLGSIWLNGGGNYGAPLDISYDSITLGNEGILPRTTILKYIDRHFGRLWDIIQKAIGGRSAY